MNEESIKLQQRYDGFIKMKTVKKRDIDKFKINVDAMPVEVSNLELQIEHAQKEKELKLTKIEQLKIEIKKSELNEVLIKFRIEELGETLPIIKNNLKITQKNLKAVEQQLKDIKSDARNKGIKLEV